MISDHGLLYIEPKQPASPTPVIDCITRKMCAAYRKARPSDWASGGYHSCICGAMSEDHDFHLPNGDLTNSLCVHYLAYHRSEVPTEQLTRIEAFTTGEVEPSGGELAKPRPVRTDLPREIQTRLTAFDAQIEAINRAKEAAVAEQDFERAARLRDEADQLRKQAENLIRGKS